MNTFSFFYTLQMLVWLVVSPYVAHFFFVNNYEHIHYLEPIIIPLVLLYIVAVGRRKNFSLDFSDARLDILLLILVLELIFLNVTNYISRGGTEEMVRASASTGLVNFLVYKFIIYSNVLSFFIGLINLKRNIVLALFIILSSFLVQYYLFGLSKAAFINLMLVSLFLSGVSLSFKRVFWVILFALLVMVFVSVLRSEVSTVQELLKSLIIRTDGLSLVLNDESKERISWLSFADGHYFQSMLASLFRLFGNNELLLAGLSGPKAIYLHEIGHQELDYSASFLVDMVILFGYFVGIILSFLIVIFLHNFMFSLSKNNLTIIKMSLLCSLILSSFMVDRSLIDYILGPLKSMPFIYLYLKLLYNPQKKFNV